MVWVTVPATGLLKDPNKAPSSWEGEHIPLPTCCWLTQPNQVKAQGSPPYLSQGHSKSVMENWGDASQLATPSLCSPIAPLLVCTGVQCIKNNCNTV